MAWLQACIETESQLAERLADALIEVGALSVTIEDALAGTAYEEAIFGEPGEKTGQLWQHSRVVTLFKDDVDVTQLIAALCHQHGLMLPSFTVETVPEQDWVQATQAQFEPISISPRLWIIPTWHTPPVPEAINLQLDPGLAFGTGSHPTTRLCLEWLDNHITGNEVVVDYGCGSGILAIAALKLGAIRAIGVDIDAQALQASHNNAKQNGVSAEFYLPDQIPSIKCDMLLANILANPLRMLAGLLAGYVKKKGKIVLSGILTDQAEELTEIYSVWFDIEAAPVSDEGWIRLIGTRR